MHKNKFGITEDEILSDDGIFAAKIETVYDSSERCCHCGFPILPGEEVFQLLANGDVIHKGCWQEYAEENSEAFGKTFVYSDDADFYA